MPEISIPDAVSEFIDSIRSAVSTPSGTLITAAAVVAIVALIVGYLSAKKVATALWRSRVRARARRRELAAATSAAGRAAAREAARAAGPLAVLGVLGSLVSLYGLYGFATDTGQLPVVYAVLFCLIFDGAELTCFWLLYLAAGQERHWTPSMRKAYRVAWSLVAASAAMNFVHAPGGLLGAVALAAVPVVSAFLSKMGLDRILEAKAQPDEHMVAPGPGRLVQLLWLHLWARIFAALGLDAGSGNGQVPLEARIRRAASVLTDLARRLDHQDELAGLDAGRLMAWQRARAAVAVDRARRRAHAAIDAAGVATDRAASLSLARHLVARGRAADLARMDVTDPMAVLTLLEELAITPSAEAIEAGARAVLAEQAAEAAQRARVEAEKARDVAVADMEAAREREREMVQARAGAEQARDAAVADMEAARGRAREAAAAAEVAEGERARAEQARSEAEKAAQVLQADVGATSQAREAAQRAVREAEELVRRAGEEAERLSGRAREAASQQACAEAMHRELEERAGRLRQEVDALSRKREQAAAEVSQLRVAQQETERAVAVAQAQVERDRAAAEHAAQERRAAQAALSSAQSQILAVVHGEQDVVADWRSSEKQAGWEYFSAVVRTEGREPTAAEMLAAVGGAVHAGTVRAWLPKFRERHAAEVVQAASAAHGPQVAASVSDAAAPQSRNHAEQPQPIPA